MARVKRGVTTRAKHKNILEQAKGYRGRRKNTIRVARQAVEKAGQYAGGATLLLEAAGFCGIHTSGQRVGHDQACVVQSGSKADAGA